MEDVRYQDIAWGEYYELYNVLDVTLMADAFELFRNTTLKAFGVDPMHSITAPQMAYSLFLKVTMEGDHSESSLMTLARKWAQYIMRINANEGLEERQLVKVFLNRMGEFYESKGIRLMETNEIDDFIHSTVEKPGRRHHSDRETAREGGFAILQHSKQRRAIIHLLSRRQQPV